MLLLLQDIRVSPDASGEQYGRWLKSNDSNFGVIVSWLSVQEASDAALGRRKSKAVRARPLHLLWECWLRAGEQESRQSLFSLAPLEFRRPVSDYCPPQQHQVVPIFDMHLAGVFAAGAALGGQSLEFSPCFGDERRHRLTNVVRLILYETDPR